jgi:hypothetical protein
MKACTACAAEIQEGAAHCRYCNARQDDLSDAASRSAINSSMDVDLSAHVDVKFGALISADYPEVVNRLLGNLGQGEDAERIWQTALRLQKWPPSQPLPESQRLDSSVLARPAHELVAAAIAEICGRVEFAGDDQPLLWLAGAADEGLFMFAGETFFLNSGTGWSVVGDLDLGAQDIADVVGGVDALIFCLDGFEELLDWNPYFEDYFHPESPAIGWLTELAEDGTSHNDIVEVPVPSGPSVYLIDAAWEWPFLGPPSPDPNSTFHRLRLSALSLALDGFSVTVDFGPIMQNFDDFKSPLAARSGEVFLSTGPLSNIMADGTVPQLRLMQSPPDDEAFIQMRLKDFGLTLE